MKIKTQQTSYNDEYELDLSTDDSGGSYYKYAIILSTKCKNKSEAVALMIKTIEHVERDMKEAKKLAASL